MRLVRALVAMLAVLVAACSGELPAPGGPAATAEIVGRCVDARGEPLPGVDVRWRKNANSLLSGADGRFRLELVFDAHFDEYPATLALRRGDAPAREVPIRVHDGQRLDLGDVVLE